MYLFYNLDFHTHKFSVNTKICGTLWEPDPLVAIVSCSSRCSKRHVFGSPQQPHLSRDMATAEDATKACCSLSAPAMARSMHDHSAATPTRPGVFAAMAALRRQAVQLNTRRGYIPVEEPVENEPPFFFNFFGLIKGDEVGLQIVARKPSEQDVCVFGRMRAHTALAAARATTNRRLQCARSQRQR